MDFNFSDLARIHPPLSIREEANALTWLTFRTGFLEELRKTTVADLLSRGRRGMIDDVEMKRLNIETSARLEYYLRLKGRSVKRYWATLLPVHKNHTKNWDTQHKHQRRKVNDPYLAAYIAVRRPVVPVPRRFSIRQEANGLAHISFRAGYLEELHGTSLSQLVKQKQELRLSDSEIQQLMTRSSAVLAYYLEIKQRDAFEYYHSLREFYGHWHYWDTTQKFKPFTGVDSNTTVI